MTPNEAKEWRKVLSPTEIEQILIEYDAIKQGVCARILGVPTGSKHWVRRSHAAAERLVKCEHTALTLIRVLENQMEMARFQIKTSDIRCSNCEGQGELPETLPDNEEGEKRSCVICKGTGRKWL